MPSTQNKMPVEIDQAKVWEDNELTSFWDEAKREYDKYHSIQATGEVIEDIEAEMKAIRDKWDAKKAKETEETDEPINDEVDEDPSAMDTVSASEADETPSAKNEPSSTPNHDATTTEGDKKQLEAAQSGLPTPAADLRAAALGPQAVLGTVKDDALKKLLMSWYYAGYYTGLHEGQQQSQQKPSEG